MVKTPYNSAENTSLSLAAVFIFTTQGNITNCCPKGMQAIASQTMLGVILLRKASGSIILLSLILSSCKKNETSELKIKQPLKVDEYKISFKPRTEAELQLVENIQKLSEILKGVYLDQNNVKVVNAAVFAKVYTDESIMVGDLIYPDEGRLANSKRFNYAVTKHNLSISKFVDDFWTLVKKKNDLGFMSFLRILKPTQILVNSSTAAGYNPDGFYRVSIYFPYHEEFADESFNASPGIVSITAATSDADEGIGQIPVYDSYGSFLRYDEVLVNDDYAILNPTHIIGVNGIEPYDLQDIPNTAFPPSGPIDMPGFPREVKQVYVGSVKIHNEQYDNFISFTGNGGGSEIVFTRSDGFLKVLDGQVQADNFSTPPKEISRRDIRKKNWVDFSYEWDGDWEQDNLNQVFNIYEEDNRNTLEVSGKISTTLKFSDMLTTTIDLISWKVTF